MDFERLASLPGVGNQVVDACYTALLVGIWYFSNFRFGFGLKRTSYRFQDAELFIFLLWVLFFSGWLVAAACKLIWSYFAGGGGGHGEAEQADTPRSEANTQEAGVKSREESGQLLVIMHVLGMGFTCMAFITGSVPVVQVFKGLAPIFTTLFSLCYLNAVLPYSAVSAVVLLVAGATLSSWKQPGFSVAAVVMCMVTNISLPLRNVLVKQRSNSLKAAAARSQPGTPLREHPTPAAAAAAANAKAIEGSLDIAVELNFGGLVIMTALCLIFMRRLTVPYVDLYIAFRLGLHRIIYEIASLLVLARIDAVMHGALDVLKRAAMTLVALATLQSEPAHPINVLGALLAFSTLLWYKLSISKQAAKGQAGGVTQAFHLPPQWQWATAWLLKAALAIFTTAGLRLFMLSQTVCE